MFSNSFVNLVVLGTVTLATLAGVLMIRQLRRFEKLGYRELEGRWMRARVDLPGWRAAWTWYLMGWGITLISWVIYRVYDHVGFLLLAYTGLAITFPIWVSRARRRRELIRRLEVTGDRICPQCLYSLEGSVGDGTCPECGTAYTDEGLHVSWAFLHGAKIKKPAASRLR